MTAGNGTLRDYIWQDRGRAAYSAPRQRFFHIRWLVDNLGAVAPIDGLAPPRVGGNLDVPLDDCQNQPFDPAIVCLLELAVAGLEAQADVRAPPGSGETHLGLMAGCM